MSIYRRILGVMGRGVLVGVTLAVLFPPQPADAFGGCTCEDTGSGRYECDGQTACNFVGIGGEKCEVTCI